MKDSLLIGNADTTFAVVVHVEFGLENLFFLSSDQFDLTKMLCCPGQHCQTSAKGMDPNQSCDLIWGEGETHQFLCGVWKRVLDDSLHTSGDQNVIVPAKWTPLLPNEVVKQMHGAPSGGAF